eukprot:scaffold868_cov351-Pavlova_lutheri.AAC.18
MHLDGQRRPRGTDPLDNVHPRGDPHDERRRAQDPRVNRCCCDGQLDTRSDGGGTGRASAVGVYLWMAEEGRVRGTWTVRWRPRGGVSAHECGCATRE